MINISSFTSAHFIIDSFQAKKLFNGDRSLPIFEEGRRTRYTAREATGILLGQQHMKCTKTPLRARRNVSFIISVEEESWADVKADMNGIYRRMLRCCTWTVEVDGRGNQVHQGHEVHQEFRSWGEDFSPSQHQASQHSQFFV